MRFPLERFVNSNNFHLLLLQLLLMLLSLMQFYLLLLCSFTIYFWPLRFRFFISFAFLPLLLLFLFMPKAFIRELTFNRQSLLFGREDAFLVTSTSTNAERFFPLPALFSPECQINVNTFLYSNGRLAASTSKKFKC